MLKTHTKKMPQHRPELQLLEPKDYLAQENIKKRQRSFGQKQKLDLLLKKKHCKLGQQNLYCNLAPKHKLNNT
jgi:hypothetical protein